MSSLFDCSALNIRRGERRLCENLNIRIEAGECWGILGVNGAGKSTLLHTLAGLIPIERGHVRFKGKDLIDWRRIELARELGLMPQDSYDAFPATVLEIVLMGRHPHLSPWQRETEADYRRAHESLASAGLAGFEDREVGTLSGGERRRLALAVLLTQDPRVLLLDEPTNHLDLHHQVSLLTSVRQLTHQDKAAVLVMHDLNLTRRYCDQVLLLYGDGRWAAGETEEMMEARALTELYRHPIRVLSTEAGDVLLPG